MTPEWEELKTWLSEKQKQYIRRDGEYKIICKVMEQMETIERRTLLGRVAKLLDGFDHDAWQRSLPHTTRSWSGTFGEIVRIAIVKGYTAELEKWQKKP